MKWLSISKLTLLFLWVLFNHSFRSSFATLTNNSDSENPLKHELNCSIGGTVSERKFSHAGGRGGGGGNGGHSGGEGSNANSGQANTSPRGAGGGAVIPVYAAGAAGAAGQRNNHRSASNVYIIYGKDGLLLIVLTTILTSLLLHICM